MDAKEFIHGSKFVECGINGTLHSSIVAIVVNGDGDKGAKVRLGSDGGWWVVGY